MNPAPLTILLLEDDPDDARLLTECLREAGVAFEIVHVPRLAEAVEQAAVTQVDVALLDLSVLDSEGLDTLRSFQVQVPGVPVIVLTGMNNRRLAVQAVHEGAQDFLSKADIEPSLLGRSVFYAIERHYLKTALAQTNEVRFRTLIERQADAILLVSHTGIIQFVNPASEVLLGRKAADLLGNEFGFPITADDAAGLRILHPRKGVVVEMRVTEVEWENTPAYLVSLRDVTERHQAHAEHERLIRELEAKNAELERFTYTVSHDLKSPLVTIGGFIGLLEHFIRAGETEQIQMALEKIEQATEKMNDLLDDLLNLSRMGHLMNPPMEVSLSALAGEALALLEGPLSEREVQVDLDPDLPTVLVDPLRLREVFQNLLDNAVKYMGDQRAPRIEIGVVYRDEEPIYYVRDNGIGIAPDYQERVFGLFRRLRQEGPGTGIGLALVRRIIETHGGRIWVESEGEGQGCMFCFTLVAPAPEQPA